MRRFIKDMLKGGAGIYELEQRIARLSEELATKAEMPAINAEIGKAREAVIHRVNQVNDNLYLHLREASRVRELYYRDVMLVLDRLAAFLPKTPAVLHTEKPIAVDTDDHKFPWGTMNDNTRLPRFVEACERYFGDGRRLNFIDLGCSGGGLVLDFILRGHGGFGIEGSDFSRIAQRAEWRILRDCLFTADITAPYRLTTPYNAPIKADVISAWEVMEHIAEEDLPALFSNVRNHLTPDGIFVGSICMVRDDDPKTGAAYHRTVKPRDWWENRFQQLGMRMIDNHGFRFGDFCRGTGNGLIDENYAENPHIGFHYVAVLSA